ncbi:thymidylate synthase [Micromonospora sp. LH3U1]|uniref:thymidylate synthase n=1 Tax=Micromonospora sp. LH3U1 TaxID=3018339 RepID=UPI00234B9EC6|nr:thymidylate synthase [Micromonospora sp. LH3U1]WCN81964.1 thymidylate synthase [Micromonospora sp. LH3U1]
MELVLRQGHETHDNEVALKELLNVSLSAESCADEHLLEVGADPARLKLMIDKYASLSVLPMYKVSYGKLFRDHAGINQLAWLTRRLKLRPEAKSATIGFHSPGDEMLSCISLVDCKLRSGRLYLTAIFRSQNVFASQPGNAAALRRIQAEVAHALGVPPGPLTLHIMSAHVYEGDWDAARHLVSVRRGAGAGVRDDE